jgi:AraC family transcriptional regulator
MHVTEKARSASLAVHEYRCEAGPHDAPFTEVHREYSISLVRHGSFGYLLRGRLYELIPGSLLVGRMGDEYTCTHEHHACGDVCLSFQFSPAIVEEVGEDRDAWRVGGVPPLPELMVMGELAQAVADGRSTISFDEVAYLLLARWLHAVASGQSRSTKLRAHDRQRVIDIARWIEVSSHEDIDLDQTACAAGMSPHHLLRTFARVLGITPHQYLIRARLRHAARLLTDDGSTITQIAGAVGFADLSNFIRTFGRAAGMSPQQFRNAAKGGLVAARAAKLSFAKL